MPSDAQAANRSAICLVIDRLRARALGCYGNGWYETPAFDRLAVDSTLFDQSLADSVHLKSLCRSWWVGYHALRSAEGVSDSWTAQLTGRVATTLVTDEPELARSDWAAPFSDVIEVPRGRTMAAAGAVQNTQFARVAAVAADWLASHRASGSARPYLLWIHASGMNSTWDAPTSLRQSLAEEEDPIPGAETTVPSRRLAESYDPDEVFMASCAYAAQVMAVDASLGELIDAARIICGDDEPLWLVTGARGFPLGEHLRLGPVDDASYVESVHTPLIVRLPRAEQPLNRVQSLVQTADVAATLADWFGLSHNGSRGDGRSLLPLIDGRSSTIRDHALTVSASGERGLRTSAWYLRRPAEGPAELFVRPDDLWEANDVSSRCEEIVARMSDALAICEASYRSTEANEQPRLEQDLTETAW